MTSDACSIGDNGPDGFLLSDAAIDWIEELPTKGALLLVPWVRSGGLTAG